MTTTTAVAPNLQSAVDKYVSALNTPHRLLSLAPTGSGNPGNAAALSPAIVLTTISAFEGFAEDFLAMVLALQGAGFGEIANQIGSWNNPTLKTWQGRLRNRVGTPAQAVLSKGPMKPIAVYRPTAAGNWSAGGRAWADVLDYSEAWMQVRHALTHGLATGWRVERWPSPLKSGTPRADSVLRPKTHGRHSLDRSGAISCARIYSLGAVFVADVVAQDVGQSLNWSALPSFG